MIITVASFKGGVGKTTTAVHLATYLQTFAPTLLIDGDPNRSASVDQSHTHGSRTLSYAKTCAFDIARTQKSSQRLQRDSNRIVKAV